MTKRRYMGKDLLGDRYGRYFEIPEELAKRGHVVSGLTLAYRKPSAAGHDPMLTHWESRRLTPVVPVSLAKYRAHLHRIIHEMRPDVIWAGSDALHAILGAHAAHIGRIPLVIDLYDNYEAYGLTNFPGIRPLFIRSCRKANAITVVGRRLKRYISTAYEKHADTIHVIENAINGDLFRKYDRQAARGLLKLPSTGKLIGTAGALTESRGIGSLIEAFLRIAGSTDDTFLVVAGPRDRFIERFSHERIIDLGMLPLDKVPLLFSALDVAVVCNKYSVFAEYCFPQKFYEIVACGTPVVAADVGEMQDFLENDRELLFDPGSSVDLERAILKQIHYPSPVQLSEVPTWRTRAALVETALESVIS